MRRTQADHPDEGTATEEQAEHPFAGQPARDGSAGAPVHDTRVEDGEVTLASVVGSNPSMAYDDPRRAALEELVDAAREGDHGAFEELVRRTHADTYGLAKRLVTNEDDARDVVQDAYLRAFRSIGRFRGDAQFSTWLYRITANCASTHLGKRRRHHHEELDEDASLLDTRPEHDPSVATDGTLLRERLEASIAALPPRLRAVVVLRDIYDLTHGEIAEELGISEAAAKVRLHRARRKLRTEVLPLRGELSTDDHEEQARAV